MIDLKAFYLKHVKDSSPYIKYYDNIEAGIGNSPFDFSTESFEVIIHDKHEAKQKFKQLIQPGNTYSNLDSLKFILLCFYLNYHGYYIKQFPNFLSLPTNLNNFATDKIRNYLIVKEKDNNGTVRWAERRKFIGELQFEKGKKIYTNFHESIEERFREISTRGAAFDNMSNHEKLKEIANYLENLLKVDGKYISINKNKMLNLISDDFIKKYRNTLQCYRHSTESSLKQRGKLKDKESFLIYLGISIIHGLQNTKQTKERFKT